MKKRKLPFKAFPNSAPDDIKQVIDSIMIYPRSMGKLNAGSYSKNDFRPFFDVVVSATNKEFVDVEQKLLGSEEHYTVIYEVSNRNDSPAFVYVKRKQ